MNEALFTRLVAVADEFEAARAGLAVLQRSLRDVPLPPEAQGVALSQARNALARLEATYTIRLFAEFEGLLRYHLTANLGMQRVPGTARGLIDRVGSRYHMDPGVRQGAHAVREYRNALVHPGELPVVPLTLRQALSRLNTFLSWIR